VLSFITQRRSTVVRSRRTGVTDASLGFMGARSTWSEINCPAAITCLPLSKPAVHYPANAYRAGVRPAVDAHSTEHAYHGQISNGSRMVLGSWPTPEGVPHIYGHGRVVGARVRWATAGWRLAPYVGSAKPVAGISTQMRRAPRFHGPDSVRPVVHWVW
jgi:hypothetical protein